MVSLCAGHFCIDTLTLPHYPFLASLHHFDYVYNLLRFAANWFAMSKVRRRNMKSIP
ncbi:hypothetical protein THZG08_400036 [Vibrio owensii]|nr:hypothetical protein THZG08_400036 [Vibrio owensii]CAH1577743.1 hypothetical protein THOA03_400037 [Vibrio owensii]